MYLGADRSDRAGVLDFHFQSSSSIRQISKRCILLCEWQEIWFDLPEFAVKSGDSIL